MDAQQLHDFIIKPTLKYMGGNYYSKNAAMLLLSTAAIESNCGQYVSQLGCGIAKGIWQMEDATHDDIWDNCDALKNHDFSKVALDLNFKGRLGICDKEDLILSPAYACAMARLKYGMDRYALPSYSDMDGIYHYYKRVYNTEFGASTFDKFKKAWVDNDLDSVEL